MVEITQAQRLLSVETSLGADVFILQSVEGEEFLSKPFSFVLEMFANKPQTKIDKLLGQSVNWTIKDGDDARVFNGIVHQFDVGKQQADGVSSYIMRVQPWFSLLQHTSDCKVFQNKTVLQIIKTVFDEFGFNDYKLSVNAKPPSRDYCVQYNETAFDFVSRLLTEEGLFYFFTHEKNKHTMVIADSKSAYVKSKEEKMRLGGAMKVERCIQYWQSCYRYGTGSYVQTDYDFTAPKMDLLTKVKTLNKRKDNDKLSYFSYPGCYSKKQDGNNISQRLMQMIETDECVIEAQSSYRGLSAGTSFKLDEESYVIIRIAHHAEDHTHVSGGRGQQRYINNFSCILSDTPYRPPIKNIVKPRIQGVQTAVVVGPSGEEIYTDKYGRIKVQFFWDRYGENNEKSSCWVRVAQVWAGNQWGGLCLPRVGDEVVVNFLDGDPDKPLVIGSVYNGEQVPPYALPDQKTITGIKTHSTKEGQASDSNEISFDDKKDSELFYSHAQKDRHGVIENDDTLEVKHDCKVTIDNDYQLTVSEGNYTQEIKKGKRTTTIEQDEKLTVSKGAREVNVEQGNASLTVAKGNHSVKVSMGHDELTVSQGNQTTTVSLGKSTTKAMQGIELVVGQNSVKIDQTGVTIKGMMIKINGQAMTQVNASGMLQLKGGITMIN